MVEHQFDWEPATIWEYHISWASTPPQPPSKNELFLMVRATDIIDILALANASDAAEEQVTFTFDSNSTEFGTDNCTTHHL